MELHKLTMKVLVTIMGLGQTGEANYGIVEVLQYELKESTLQLNPLSGLANSWLDSAVFMKKKKLLLAAQVSVMNEKWLD